MRVYAHTVLNMFCQYLILWTHLLRLNSKFKMLTASKVTKLFLSTILQYSKHQKFLGLSFRRFIVLLHQQFWKRKQQLGTNELPACQNTPETHSNIELGASCWLVPRAIQLKHSNCITLLYYSSQVTQGINKGIQISISVKGFSHTGSLLAFAISFSFSFI